MHDVYKRLEDEGLPLSDDRWHRLVKAGLISGSRMWGGSRTINEAQLTRLRAILMIERHLGGNPSTPRLAYYMCFYGMDAVPVKFVAQEMHDGVSDFMKLAKRVVEGRLGTGRAIRNARGLSKERRVSKLIIRKLFRDMPVIDHAAMPAVKESFEEAVAILIGVLMFQRPVRDYAHIIRRLIEQSFETDAVGSVFPEVLKFLEAELPTFSVNLHTNRLLHIIRPAMTSKPLAIPKVVKLTGRLFAAFDKDFQRVFGPSGALPPPRAGTNAGYASKFTDRYPQMVSAFLLNIVLSGREHQLDEAVQSAEEHKIQSLLEGVKRYAEFAQRRLLKRSENATE